MDRLDIERLGGLAGIGLPGSRIRSQGSLDLATLAPADRATVHALFSDPPPPARPLPDAFRYRLTRHTPAGVSTIEVADHQVPGIISATVRDVLA